VPHVSSIVTGVASMLIDALLPGWYS
jgi:hypothetical protein